MTTLNDRQDAAFWSGEDKILRVTVRDEAGAAVNLTGMTAAWALARDPLSPVLVSKTSAAGIALTNPAAGVLEVTLLPADTEALSGLYYHELELTDAAGLRFTALSGAITLAHNLL